MTTRGRFVVKEKTAYLLVWLCKNVLNGEATYIHIEDIERTKA